MLLHAVRERLGPGAWRTGHRLVGFEQDATGVRAHFADRNGPVDPVHADDVHSTVQSILFPA